MDSTYATLALSLTAVLFSACGQIQPSVYGTFDASDKTLAVPATNRAPIQVIKDNLRKEGWDIRISGANSFIGNNMTSTNATSRYTLVVEHADEQKPTPGSISGPELFLYTMVDAFSDPVYDVSATIFDNRDGREILNYSGPLKISKGKTDIITETIVRNTR